MLDMKAIIWLENYLQVIHVFFWYLIKFLNDYNNVIFKKFQAVHINNILSTQQTWLTTILVVSHDRLFLDAVSTDIIHLHSCKLESYKGNYEVFHKTRDERIKNLRKEYEAQKQYRDHIQVCQSSQFCWHLIKMWQIELNSYTCCIFINITFREVLLKL